MIAPIAKTRGRASPSTDRAHRPIASLPAIALATLLPRRQPPALFPFTDPQTELFYLGRGAVWHAAKRLGLAGTDVLVPAYHHGVEVEALIDAGVRPRFYGVQRNFEIDVDSVIRRITGETKALYVIHYAGFPQPMDDLLAIARERRLKVIEDCALALYSSSEGEPLGARADAAIFCLYKTLPVPHGGALWMPTPWRVPRLRPVEALVTFHQLAASMLARFSMTGNPVGAWLRSGLRELAQTVRAVSPLPVDERPVGHRHFVPGEQHLGMAPITQRIIRGLDAQTIVEQRRRNYYSLMSRIHDVSPPMQYELRPGVCPLFYPLWCDDKSAVQRQLATEGIETIDFWSEGSSLVRQGEFPDVDALRAHVLELPIHQDLGSADMEVIAEAVRRALRASAP